jgi:uncharacterized membrane protein
MVQAFVRYHLVIQEGRREACMNGSDNHWLERGSELERPVFFSDAVFAIAITLLALEIQVPQVAADSAAALLPSALLSLWPKFFSFLISFWVVGNYWPAHHRTFHYIGGYDRGLLLINLLFLMWIVLLPFSSSLVGEYGNQQIVAIIYAVHIVVAGLTLSWVWWHASREPGLLDTSRVNPREFRYNQLRALAVPLIFLLSIGVSFLSVWATQVLWCLAFLIRPVLLRILRYSTR